MKISELMGVLDLAWQEHGDLDIWFYAATRPYDAGGGPGLADTGGGYYDETEMRRLYSAFPGTDDYNRNDKRLFVSTSPMHRVRKRTEHASQRHRIHIFPLEEQHESN